MGKKSSQKRAAKTGKRTIERRNRRHQYSPKPSQQKIKRLAWPLPPTPQETQRGADALMALLLMGSRPSMPWMGREYWKAR